MGTICQPLTRLGTRNSTRDNMLKLAIFICGVALVLAQDAPSAPDASPAVEPVADQNVAQLFYRRFGGYGGYGGYGGGYGGYGGYRGGYGGYRGGYGGYRGDFMVSFPGTSKLINLNLKNGFCYLSTLCFPIYH